MTLTISHDLESRLLEKAARDGKDANVIAEAMLSATLDWDAEVEWDAVAGIQKGMDAGAAGRERSLDAYIAEQRVKRGFPASWPSA